MSPLPFLSTRRRGRRTRGQSLVEFALILPLMLVFLAAVLDLGRVFYATVTLHNAAREGAFEAASDPASFDAGQPCSTATNMVVCRVQLESKDSAVEIDPADISMTCSQTGCPAQAGSTVTVEVTGEFTLITPLLAAVFGGQTIPMAASATAQLEYLPDPHIETLPPPPVAVIDIVSENGLTVTFDASGSSGDPTGYTWAFGDGDTSNDGPDVTHTFPAPGEYTVTLSIVNASGDDDVTRTITVGNPPPSSSASASASTSPSPTSFNCFPPNVIGQSPSTAIANLINAGFTVDSLGDLSTGQKGKVQAQNPDHTECKPAGTLITIHWRPL